MVRNTPFYEGQQPPVCAVSLLMKSTNIFKGWREDPPTYLEIELLDSSEKPVERTEDGKTYEKLMSADHLQERIYKHLDGYYSGHFRTSGFLPNSSKINRTLTTFSIPQLFKIKHPGEYILRVTIIRFIELLTDEKV